jgi:DNA modification methylase
MNRAAGSNFTKTTEFAILLGKGVATLQRQQQSSHFLSGTQSAKEFGHPFAKPLELWSWVLSAIAAPGDLILDPFAGSGTCPYACAKMGFKPLALELKEVHFNRMVLQMQEGYTKWMAPRTVKFK